MKALYVGVFLAAAAMPASAEIVFQYGTSDSVVRYYPGGAMMPSIVMTPGATISPQVSYSMQRARSWANYRRGGHANGAALVLVPGYSGYFGAASDRQAAARAHVARAHAYRMGYYK
jgi:hypothetical protein